MPDAGYPRSAAVVPHGVAATPHLRKDSSS
jgi:hypothetical protein